MNCLRAILFFVAFVACINVKAAGGDIFFNYSSADGMSSDYVHSVCSDRYGFLWLATHHGVCRFDGKSFKVFTVAEYPSLLCNEVYHVYKDSLQDLYFAGSNGVIVRYDYESDSFVNMAPADFEQGYYKSITGISNLNGESLYISTSGGVYVLDPEKKCFVPVLSSLKDKSVLEIFQDSFGRFWVGMNNGVKVLDKEENLFFENDLSVVNEYINNIVRIDNQNILLCSTIGSVWHVSLRDNGDLESVRMLDTPFSGASDVIVGHKGKIWFGTPGNGVWRSTFINGKFEFENVVGSHSKHEITKITSVYEDCYGSVWVGTHNSGLWRIMQKDYVHIMHSSDFGMQNVIVSSFYENDDNTILCGSDGNGVFLVGADHTPIKNFTTESGLPCNNALSVDGIQDNIVVSFWGGISSYIDVKGNRVTPVEFNGIENPSVRVKGMLFNNGKAWAVTAGDGLYFSHDLRKWRRCELQDTSMLSYPDLWLNKILYLKSGVFAVLSSRTIWIGNDSIGFKSILPDLNKTPQYNPVVYRDAVADDNGGFYVATNKGVSHSDTKGNVKNIDFLPKCEFYSVKKYQEKLWLSSSIGVINADVKAKVFSVVFSAKGLGNDYFVERSSALLKNGDLLFGCKDGYVIVNNNANNSIPCYNYLSFASLFADNDTVLKGMSGRVSDSNISIELPFDKTNIVVGIDAIDFSGLKNIEMVYRIASINSAWQEVDDNIIRISHLPSGTHLLEVCVREIGEDMPIRQISMDITVMPPWWMSWWFSLIVICFVMFLTYIFLSLRIKRVSRQKKELEQQVEARTKDLNNANEVLKEQKELLVKKNNELSVENRNRNQMISIIAHDLRNPMFAIVTALDGVVNKKKKAEDNAAIINSVFRYSVSLQEEMNKLLEWAMLSDNSLAYLPQNTNLSDLVGEVVSLLGGMFGAKSLSVKCNVNLSRYVFVDRRMMSTVIRNILTNAIKFTPDGNSISISGYVEGDKAVLEVKDTGIGMSQKQIDAVLLGTAVVSSDGTRQEKGTGIGFRLVREFVERNGGELRVKSVVGEGTTIIVSLPLSEEVLPESEFMRFDDDCHIDQNVFRDKTILVADDDPLILLHLRSVLSQYVKVEEASNGEECIRMAEAIVPDLIVCDVDMPVLDGLGMLAKLRDSRSASNIPLLFLSANHRAEVKLQGLSGGALDFITKPFDDKELIFKIQNILVWQLRLQGRILTSYFDDIIENKEGEETVANDINPLLKQLMELIKANYGNSEYSFDAMSVDMAMSKSTLSRRIKSLTDKTPVEILSEYRLNLAYKMLSEGDTSVSDVAYKVGFNDPLYFSRKYKEKFGKSPSKK